MKKIFTEEGDEIFVDDDMYIFLSRFRFHTKSDKGKYKRPKCRIGGATIGPEHFIVGSVKGALVIDHINRNPFDNRRINLRICSVAQNGYNTSKQKNRSSIYKGVYKPKGRKKFRCTIHKDNKSYFLGNFYNEIDAAHVYDKKARELFCEFAYLNFPEENR